MVQAMLEWAGAPYRLIPVDLRAGRQREAAFLAVNPMGQVPVLVLPEGEVLTESAAMVLHLGEAFPGTGLVPAAGDPARPRFLRWLLFLACNVYAECLRYNHPERYGAGAGCAEETVRASAAARLERLWQLIDEALVPGPCLLGPEVSAADIYFVMMTDWALPRARVLARWPAIARAFDIVRARDPVARIWHDNGMD